jgi:hypothetical protein
MQVIPTREKSQKCWSASGLTSRELCYLHKKRAIVSGVCSEYYALSAKSTQRNLAGKKNLEKRQKHV